MDLKFIAVYKTNVMNDFHCELHKIYEVSGLTGPDSIYGSPVSACAALLFIKH